MPLVSVIIPCYNQGIFLDDAVSSVLEQTFQDVEIIVVNDGSTEQSTLQIVRDFDRPKTRVITTDNFGLAAARNNGIKESTGRYILPLDADDRIGPTYLEKAVELLESQPELGIVYCQARLFGAVDCEWQLPEFSLETMLLDNVIFCSALFRRSDWQAAGGYDETLVYGWEDYDFWLSLLERGRQVYRIPEVLFYYRVSADSMVRARPRKHKLETFVRLYHKHQSLYTNNIRVWIDTLLDAREVYHQAELQFDGITAEPGDAALVRKVSHGAHRLEFSLPGESNAVSCTFLPVRDYTVVCLNSIMVEQDNTWIAVDEITDNADFSDEGQRIFCTEEPAFHFALPDGFSGGKLVVQLEYLAFGRECLGLLRNILPQEKTLIHSNRPAANQTTTTSLLHGAVLRHSTVKALLKLPFAAIHYCRFYRQYLTIKKSGLFDPVFYRENDTCLQSRLIDPLLHYLTSGWREGRKPNPFFETAWYRRQYRLADDQEPLLHYIEQGWQQGNNPNLLFSSSYYTEQYPETVSHGLTPLGHYLHQGWREAKKPNPCFDTAYYLDRHPEIAASGQNPLYHYFYCGNKELSSPMPFFDMEFYCEDNPKAKEEWMFPLQHYCEHGAAEGRTPNRLFDPVFYQQTYGLSGLSGVELFLHYAYEGSRQQYRPSTLFDAAWYGEKYPHFRQTHEFALEHYLEEGVRQGLYPCREVAELPRKPLFSILTPVFNTQERLLRRCIHSVLYQAYPHWELCLVDDGSSAEQVRTLLKEYAAKDSRIRIDFLEQNQGISAATNAAAELATGEYVAFLDHDDELTPDALYAVADAINTHDPDILYSDEELVDEESRHLERFYKPDFNPELLLCHNYITHFCITRRSLFDRVGGLSPRCAGAQDYDLLLKITELSSKVHHIRQSIYKWRATATSTSINHSQKDYADEAGLHALQSAVARRGLTADVRSGSWNYYYEVHRKLIGHPPVAIIVWTPANFQGLASWLQNLASSMEYPEVDIHLLALEEQLPKNGSLPDELAAKVSCHELPAEGNLAAALNNVAASARGEQLLFLRAGILPRQPGWIKTLLSYSQTGQYGVSGGKVTGVEFQVEDPAVPDIADLSSRAFRSFVFAASFHLNGAICPQNVLAVSFDFCMVQRALFQKVGGLNTEDFPRFLYDADFCLRLRAEGAEHVMTPYCDAKLKASEGEIVNDEESPSWQRERALFQQRWQALLLQHPYYNEQRLLREYGVADRDWRHWVAGID